MSDGAQQDIIGKVTVPGFLRGRGLFEGGLTSFISNLIVLMSIAAGLWALINLILAGLRFISVGGDPKSVGEAWNKIYNSLIGLVVIAVSYVLIAIVSAILFSDPFYILRPKICGPGIQGC